MNTKTIDLGEHKVTIWEMNYGFRSDLQGAVSSVSVGNQQDKKMSVNVGNLQIMTLVYGIYEAESLGIKKPIDIEMGLSPEEITQRLRAVRKLPRGADILYSEINKLNTDADEEVLKKSATP